MTGTASKNHLRLWLRMLRTTRNIENILREQLRSGFDTTLPRFDVMAALDRSDKGLRMSHLSRELMVSNGNVTGIVDRLVKDGLVERIAIEGDRRATLVRLTGQGEIDFGKMASRHEIWIDQILGVFSSDETDHLLEKLDKINQEQTEDLS
ncbi:MAG: MarR family transcriptional regulator [Cohaesibacteraceae bacterium]|nr:MarR family transcriptional regulator [Cohaesibacteraceae bacterium]